MIVSPRAQSQLVELSAYVSEHFGTAYGIRLNRRLTDAVDDLALMPTRHTRVRYLLGRRYVYRRTLVGDKHRLIFTVDESAMTVEVVRADLQSSDPSSLDGLP